MPAYRNRIVSTAMYSDIGERELNEDTVVLRYLPDGILVIVADGMGGQADGITASRVAADCMTELCDTHAQQTAEGMARMFSGANEALRSRQNYEDHMKTTVVVLCVSGRMALWGHVGDSRLYHFHNGSLLHYTLDHSTAQLAVLMDETTRREIPEHPGRNRLLRVLGTDAPDPDIHEAVALQEGTHAFLLCSDGLWEYITDDDIEEMYNQSDSAEEWLSRLRGLRMQRAALVSDNHSAAAVFVTID